MTTRIRQLLYTGSIIAALILTMARTASAQIYNIQYDGATAARSGQSWIVTVTLINDGDQTPINPEITNATLHGVGASGLPASVGGMPPGGTATASLTFPLSAGAPGTTATISVSGSYTTDFGDTGSFGGGGSVNLPPLHVVSLTLGPSTIYGGFVSIGTVTLDSAAPASGVSVALFSNNHAWVYSGQTMADLNGLVDPDSGWTLQQANSVNDGGQIAGSGIAPDGQLHAFLLTPIVQIASLTFNPATVVGSQNATGTVTLNDPAPTNTVVTLTNANTAASMAASVTISAGSTSKTFPINTTAVATVTTGTITATSAGLSVSNTLTVRPIGVNSVKLNPVSVVGGGSATGTVTLGAKAAPGAITVVFSSSNPAVVPAPASIIIPAGSQTGVFTVTTNAVAAKTMVTLSATANGITTTVKLTVTP